MFVYNIDTSSILPSEHNRQRGLLHGDRESRGLEQLHQEDRRSGYKLVSQNLMSKIDRKVEGAIPARVE